MYEENDWQEPASIKDAENRKDKTIALLFNIDAQLNSKMLTDENGRRLDSQTYQLRRNKLLRQKSQVLKDLRRLRNWIRSERDAVHSEDAVMPDSVLLKRAYALFTQLREDGVDFEPRELELLDLLAARVGA